MNDVSTKPNLSPEELAGVLASYNDAAGRLKESHDTLQHEVRRLRTELAHKNRQLERRKRLAALGEMAAGLAHEIRNPLGGIQLYADLLRKDLGGQRRSVDIVDKIISGVRSLDCLVTEVLAMTHTVAPKTKPGDLAMAATAAIDLLADRIEARGVHLSCRTAGPIQAVCDHDMIRRALLNVVRNAIDAAGCDGTVTVELFQKNHRAVIQVADDGPGVKADVADRIFNPFFTTKQEGTGLGLAIVHRIVEAHEGTITVGTSPLGGALFTIKLPIDGTHAPPTHRGEDHDDHCRD